MNTYRKITIALFVVFVLMITSGAAVAGTPPPVPTPVPTPAPPSSGGYTPPSYSAPPTFQPYTEDLKSTDGSAIGSLAGVDFNTVRLTASRSTTVDGEVFVIDLGADLNSKPVTPMLDINMGDQGYVPGGMDNIMVLSAASISAQSSYGWSIKPGTVTIKFTVPASKLTGAGADTKYYIVRYDGTGYQIIPVTVATTNNSATIEAHVSDLSGNYTAVMSVPPKPAVAPSPTPAPTPAPKPVPCPTPEPAPSGILGFLPSLWASAFGTFAIGEAAGAFILIVLGRFMR